LNSLIVTLFVTDRVSREDKAIRSFCPSVRPFVRLFFSLYLFEPTELWTSVFCVYGLWP